MITQSTIPVSNTERLESWRGGYRIFDRAERLIPTAVKPVIKINLLERRNPRGPSRSDVATDHRRRVVKSERPAPSLATNGQPHRKRGTDLQHRGHWLRQSLSFITDLVTGLVVLGVSLSWLWIGG